MESSFTSCQIQSSLLCFPRSVTLCQVPLIFHRITLVSLYRSPVPGHWIEPPHPQPRRWLRPLLAASTLSPSSSWWGQLSVGGFPPPPCSPCSPPGRRGRQGSASPAPGRVPGHCPALGAPASLAFFQFLERASLLLALESSHPLPCLPGPFPPPPSLL